MFRRSCCNQHPQRHFNGTQWMYIKWYFASSDLLSQDWLDRLSYDLFKFATTAVITGF
jgi:hypothetical protein